MVCESYLDISKIRAICEKKLQGRSVLDGVKLHIKAYTACAL